MVPQEKHRTFHTVYNGIDSLVFRLLSLLFKRIIRPRDVAFAVMRCNT